MIDVKEYSNKIKTLLDSQKFSEAEKEVKKRLEQYPNQLDLLICATDVFRASGNSEKSLEYAELLITYHPNNWNGYGRSAKDLLILKHFDQAQERIKEGLEKFPNQLDLLIFATDVFRASGNCQKSLKYAELLIKHHPNHWSGYERSAKDLIALKKFEEAEKIITKGVKVSNKSILQIIKENLKNDLVNLEKLKNIKIDFKYFKSIQKQNTFEKKYSKNNKNNYCILLRCKHYQEKSVQELADYFLNYTSKENIWFVHDSELENVSLNLISVSKFRKSMGIDWSIIDRKGWLLGDLCYYATVNLGIFYKFYFLIEDDVRFCGNSFNLLLKNVEDDKTDFLAAKLKEQSPKTYPWLKNYSYSHPGENATLGCLFPVSRASLDSIKYLFQRRIEEFKYFFENKEFSRSEGFKFFSNDEAFVCNSINNTFSYSINRLPDKLFGRFFSLNAYCNTSQIQGDHVIHRYCPQIDQFNTKYRSRLNFFLFKEDPKALDEIIPIIIETLEANQYSEKIFNLTLLILSDYFKHRRPFKTSTFDYVSPALQLLKNIKKPNKINTTFAEQAKENNIYMIHDAKIPHRSFSEALVSNFKKTKINSIYMSSLLDQISLPYSLENNKLNFVASDSSVIKSGFLYMNQREKGKYFFSKDIEKINPIKFNSKNLCLIFGPGRCGSTLLSNILRKIKIASISECDALKQAEDNKTAIKRIVESFFSSKLISSNKIAFKFRADNCRFTKVYLELFPEATFIFIKRSPLEWAKSCSSKFKWSAIHMYKTYKYAYESYKLLSSSKAEVLILDYDKVECWPSVLKSLTKLLDKNSLTNLEIKIAKELSSDSQLGFINNNNKDFDSSEVEKFMSMNIPVYN